MNPNKILMLTWDKIWYVKLDEYPDGASKIISEIWVKHWCESIENIIEILVYVYL